MWHIRKYLILSVLLTYCETPLVLMITLSNVSREKSLAGSLGSSVLAIAIFPQHPSSFWGHPSSFSANHLPSLVVMMIAAFLN